MSLHESIGYQKSNFMYKVFMALPQIGVEVKGILIGFSIELSIKSHYIKLECYLLVLNLVLYFQRWG